MLNKKIAILSLIISGISYGNDDFFYEETKNGVALEESVISTTGFEISKRDITNTVTVVTAKEIEENNYQSVADVLKDIPSVNVIGDSKNPIIDMRGQGKEKAVSNIQILIDGITTSTLDTNAGHVSTQINTVPVENIEKIEVIPGGGAILYGSGTRGGIINIITKSGAGFKGGSIGSDFDSFGARKSDISYGTTVGKLGVNVNYSKNDYKGFRNGDESDSEYFEGSLKYKVSDKHNMTFKYSRYTDDSTSPRKLNKNKLINSDSNGLADGDELIKKTSKKDEFNLKYNYEITEKLTLDLGAFYQETDGTSKDHYLVNMGSMGKKNVQNDMDYIDKKMGFKPKLKLNYGENSELVLGYDLVKHNLDRIGYLSMSKETYYADFEKLTNGVFLLNKNKIGKLELTQGIRYERSDYDIKRDVFSSGKPGENISLDRSEENMAYEFVSNYLYSDTGNFYGKIEKGFTTPSATELYDKTGNKTVGYEYEENDLETEKYITFEIGGKDYIFGSFVTGAIYLTESKDEIKQIKVPKSTAFSFKNLGKTRRYGAEFSAEQYFGKLTIREGYSYVKTEILKGDLEKTDGTQVNLKGKEITEVPNHKFALGLDYELTSKLKFITDTVYTAGYYTSSDLENKDGKVNSHIVTNITLNYNYSESLRVYTGINNIFNEKYYNSINGNDIDPAAERSFNAGFKYNF